MDIAVNLLTIALVAVALALIVARLRTQKGIARAAERLMESHADFASALDRLPDVAGESARSENPAPSPERMPRVRYIGHPRASASIDAAMRCSRYHLPSRQYASEVHASHSGGHLRRNGIEREWAEDAPEYGPTA